MEIIKLYNNEFIGVGIKYIKYVNENTKEELFKAVIHDSPFEDIPNMYEFVDNLDLTGFINNEFDIMIGNVKYSFYKPEEVTPMKAVSGGILK